jgi:transposase-like protein
MLQRVRAGQSLRSVARRFGVSLCTVQRWVARAKGRRLDRVDLLDRPGGAPAGPRRTNATLEDLALATRADLKANSDLGEYGAAAVRRRLLELRTDGVPSLRTINRIFERHGALDGNRRVRRPPPPPGWYLPELAARKVELDSFDAVEGLVIGKTTEARAVDVEVLNAVSIHGGLVGSWPTTVVTAKFTANSLLSRWRDFGLPRYAQFDNDTVFQGAHQFADTFGRITRICLSLGVVPVFAPPRETGFQAAVESYNGRWQAKVWARFKHASLAELVGRSDRYVAAVHQRAAVRIEAAPPRRRFPANWSMATALQKRLAGCVVFIRRTNAAGEASLLGRSFVVDTNWPNRLVRAEVDLQNGEIRFYALRRRQPDVHRLLRKTPYTPPARRFRE